MFDVIEKALGVTLSLPMILSGIDPDDTAVGSLETLVAGAVGSIPSVNDVNDG